MWIIFFLFLVCMCRYYISVSIERGVFAGAWTQGLVKARRALYHWATFLCPSVCMLKIIAVNKYWFSSHYIVLNLSSRGAGIRIGTTGSKAALFSWLHAVASGPVLWHLCVTQGAESTEQPANTNQAQHPGDSSSDGLRQREALRNLSPSGWESLSRWVLLKNVTVLRLC